MISCKTPEIWIVVTYEQRRMGMQTNTKPYWVKSFVAGCKIILSLVWPPVESAPSDYNTNTLIFSKLFSPQAVSPIMSLIMNKHHSWRSCIICILYQLLIFYRIIIIDWWHIKCIPFDPLQKPALLSYCCYVLKCHVALTLWASIRTTVSFLMCIVLVFIVCFLLMDNESGNKVEWMNEHIMFSHN